MRYALLAFAGGCLMALGIAGLALREAPRAPAADAPGAGAHPDASRAPDLGAHRLIPSLPATPCTSPFEVVSSSLPATLGAAPVRGNVTVRVAPLPEGEHAFDVIVMVDAGLVAGPSIAGFLAGRARLAPGPGQILTFEVTVPAASGPMEIDGAPRGSRWDAANAAPRLGPPVLKGTSTQGGRVLRIDTNGRPPCLITP